MAMKYKWQERYKKQYKDLSIWSDTEYVYINISEPFDSPEAAALAMTAWAAKYEQLRSYELHLTTFWEHEQ